MSVTGVESTPNPSAFLFKVDTPLTGTPAGVSGLRGATVRAGGAAPGTQLAAVLAVPGVESVLVMAGLLTVSKNPTTAWEAALPTLLEALGGAAEGFALFEFFVGGAAAGGVPGEAGSYDAAAATVSGARIRVQFSCGLPIQCEAIGPLGLSPPQRAKLSARFGDAMALLVGVKGGTFFAGRKWVDRGVIYPDKDNDEGSEDDDAAVENSGELSAEKERKMAAAAVRCAVEEIEAAYPADRLANIVASFAAGAAASASAAPGAAPVRGSGSAMRLHGGESELNCAAAHLSMAEVDALIAEDAALDRQTEAPEASLAALRALCAFVSSGSGDVGARRTAIAYLGGTGGRGGSATAGGVFDAVAFAFTSERAPGLRRTAGDALSDLGDPRAVPLAQAALGGRGDKSKLVRWRAARICGELGEGLALAAWLETEAFDEPAYEV
jgi:hypothetical protein